MTKCPPHRGTGREAHHPSIPSQTAHISKRTVLDLVAYRRRKAERREGFRACGWKALREAVTDASYAVNHLVPLHLTEESEIAEVAMRLEECRQLALAMLKKGRKRGQ